MLFWQLYQEDVTGYLYYASNGWDSSSPTDSTVTGAKTTCTWNPHRGTYGAGNYVYGDGVLFYGMSMGKVKGCSLIGTLRVEIMRDGIEEYQMMAQLEELKGEEAAKSYVNSVSNNVVDYISMPNYDRSDWSTSMDEYDVMEYSRRALGNALEAATEETKCEHNWNNGEVTTAATCARTGVKTYTCTLCGATDNEVIPSLHTNGATWTKISGVAATCTTNGSEVYKCDICGFEKTITTTAFHRNSDYWTFSYRNDSTHNAICSVCGTTLDFYAHSMFYTCVKATCQSDGYSANECKLCHYKTEETILPQIDHNYVDGTCTMCGEAEFTITYGDIDGNGKVNSADLNTLTKYITGTISIDQYAVEAADVSGDGKVNSADSNYMIKYISGSISDFPCNKKKLTLNNIKIGLITIGDEESTYSNNFIVGLKEAASELGVSESQILIECNVPESSDCYDAAVRLASRGCSLIISDSFGHEEYMIEAAGNYPNITFCNATGNRANVSGLSNFQDIGSANYEGRYVVGVAAGEKLNQMIEEGILIASEAKVGYVATFPFAQVISDYTAFYLGVKSVCPSAVMSVKFTSSWYNPESEAAIAQDLISDGCVLLAQYSDSLATANYCEEHNVPYVLYNNTMEGDSENCVASFNVNWFSYSKYIIEAVVNGDSITSDWVGTIENGSITFSFNTVRPLYAADAISTGTLHVFDTSTFTVDGENITSWMADVYYDEEYTADTDVVSDGYFHEQEYRSSPYFDIMIDGITLLNTGFDW